MSTAEFLIEIGTEEIPAEWLDVLIGAFEANLNGIAETAGIHDKQILCLGTPRRLVWYTESLRLHQRDRKIRKVGPPANIGRTAQGEWTRAALGFARRLGLEGADAQAELSTKPVGGREYVVVDRTIPGRETIQILPGFIEKVLRDTAGVEPVMHWDARIGGRPFPFTRPIRWVVGLFNGEVIPFRIEVEGATPVVAGKVSRGHRFRSRVGEPGEPFEVTSFASLRDDLRDRYVILSSKERLGELKKALVRVAEPGILSRLKQQKHHNLVEWPGAVRGQYDNEFVDLPKEIRRAVLVHHQKYVPLDRDRAFLAITNMPNDPSGAIRRGAERVVRARMRDARFFWDEALRRPLRERREDLAKVMFHQRIGNLRDHSGRVARLARWIADRVGAHPEIAEEAALLAKCDLATSLVGEFPSLQGEAGGRILQAQGLPKKTWRAVYDHYRPVGLHTDLPKTVDGATVALAERAAALAGLFAAGEAPSGSGDPFGLRRSALGMLSILRQAPGAYRKHAHGWPTPAELFRRALSERDYEKLLSEDRENVWSRLMAFVSDRLPHALTHRGMPSGVPRAVLAMRGADHSVADLWQRILALRDAVRTGDYAVLAAAHKRARRILPEEVRRTRGVELDPDRLEEAAEIELFRGLQVVEKMMSESSERADYPPAYRALAELGPRVDSFFDHVLVMAEDPEVRANRLALLARLDALFSEVGDLSQIESAAP